MADDPNLPTEIPGQFIATGPPKRPSELQRRLKRILYNAIAEAVNTVLFILVLAGARWLVEFFFGKNDFFEGRPFAFPIRYLFDVGDIAIIGRFIWNTLRSKD